MLGTDPPAFELPADDASMETNYTEFTSHPKATNVEPSSSQATDIVLHIVGGSGGGGATIIVSGGTEFIGVQPGFFSFSLPPGGTWAWYEYGGSPASSVLQSYRLTE